MTARGHRGTIFVEEAELLAQHQYPGRQFVVRLLAPRCAAAAMPGSFAHLSCDAQLPMRRPLSIMRADARAGWIEILYKIVGPGLEALSQQPVGTTLSVLGPIGHGFAADPTRPRTLLIGGGVGIPPMIFLAEALRSRRDTDWSTLVLMGSEMNGSKPSASIRSILDSPTFGNPWPFCSKFEPCAPWLRERNDKAR